MKIRKNKKTKKEIIIKEINNYLNNNITSYGIEKKYGLKKEKTSYILRNIRRHNNEINRLINELLEETERLSFEIG